MKSPLERGEKSVLTSILLPKKEDEYIDTSSSLFLFTISLSFSLPSTRCAGGRGQSPRTDISPFRHRKAR